ncbi:hypothetical protein AAG906_036897 [Vitis piasezkii]
MNFMSYEHLVEECPTIPVVREMFGDCNTYNSNWRDHPNFSWKPQSPHYQQPVQATQQALNLEQAMVNLSKVVEDFVGAQKSINAHLTIISKIQSQGGNAKMMKEKEEKREFWPLVLFPLWDIFWSTSSSPFYTYYISFRSSGSQESNASNSVQIGVETKKLWSLQENCTELKENFAPCETRCETISGTRVPFRTPQATFRTVRIKVRKFCTANQDMASKLQNDMQKHFAKPREIAKMPTEPHNHASKEESPLTEITHEVSHSISYLLKPSKLIAPTESSS